MYTRKSWREKMENPDRPKVVEGSGAMPKGFGGRTVLVPHPGDVEAVIRNGASGTAGHGRTDSRLPGRQISNRFGVPADDRDFHTPDSGGREGRGVGRQGKNYAVQAGD
ncbi:MAG TPA: hypothetical protein VKB88_08495 [Bryobacteraceae bacterium]|nr:hypothetical protein [Bryobacteraceae bacterium]